MITIPQCLDFKDDDLTKEICNFFLKLLKLKNKHLYLHSQQVANYAASTAAKLGIPPAEIVNIKTAALLHDIGHLAVPNLILNKVPLLSTRELTAYKRHCVAGACMLENIPGFSDIANIIRCHHEQWNGTGFPKRLKGANIPMGACIISVADYYDRYVNPCGHWEKPHTEAIKELKNKSGLRFNPMVVNAFMKSVIPTSSAEKRQK